MQKGKPGWAARLETAALAFALAGAMTACTAIDSGPEGIPGAGRRGGRFTIVTVTLGSPVLTDR